MNDESTACTDSASRLFSVHSHKSNPALFVWSILVDRTSTQCNRHLASSCRPQQFVKAWQCDDFALIGS